MNDLQLAKSLVRDFYRDLDKARPDDVSEVICKHVAEDYRWRGSYPFNELSGGEAVAQQFWAPYKKAFGPIQRRQNMFFGGLNRVDGEKTLWVCSMGHLLGQFHGPWLTLQPNNKMNFLRYCEFHRIEEGRIAESALAY